MSTVTAADVEAWFVDQLHLEDWSDGALHAARENAQAAGLPPIEVSPAFGAFLHLLATVRGARRILEVGTLGGYSTIWLARGGAQVVTLEIDPRHAEVARAAVDGAGVGGRVEIVVGAARETLPAQAGPFDLVFVDADKQNNAHYVRAALELTAPGALIVVDNVVRGGKVVDPDDDSALVRGVRDVVTLVADDPRLECPTALQLESTKGWDGFLVARTVS